MKIKRAMVVLAATLVVTGCTPISTENSTESIELQEDLAADEATDEGASLADETNEETTEAEAESSAVEAAKAEASTDETAEAEGEPVSDEELSTFTKMFTDDSGNNYEYFGFLWPEYSSPEEIKWDQVIAYRVDGLTEDETKLPDEEKMEFFGSTDVEGLIVDTVVKKDKLIKYIKDHTGLDVAIDAKDVSAWTYNEKYDSFLISDNPWGQDTPLFDGKFVSGTKSGDVYTLIFQPNNENWGEADKQPERTITFTKSGDKLVFKSNKFGKK